MTSILERPSVAPPPERPAPDTARRAVVAAPWLLALLVVVLRLRTLHAAPGADEAGFLVVARHWAPGTSLYGDFWVDRPPLLITIFRVADALGGLTALRLIGALAAGVVVLGAARAAREVVTLAPATAGRESARAGAWAALVAAALCVTPATGSLEVNGELLAAPFTVWGVVAFVRAVRATGRGRVVAGAALAGAGLAASVLVKQNLVDGAVFVTTFLLVGLVRRELTVRRVLTLAWPVLAGAVAVVGLVAGWTVLHGTSLAGVWDAMYPFRLRAAHAMAASGNTAPGVRLVHLLALALLTGVPLVLASVLWAAGARRLRGPGVWALLAVTGYAVVSIWAGGNYWSHYLVELVVPISVLGGVAVGLRQPGARAAAAVVALSSVLTWVVASPAPTSPGSDVGHAVAAVARPGDSIVTVYGHADVTETSGLSSPYPYLWSLPLKVRDPEGTLLARTLAGPRAPTWFVTFARVRSLGFDSDATSHALAAHYQRVAVLDGHTVYLHDGLHRREPQLTHRSPATD